MKVVSSAQYGRVSIVISENNDRPVGFEIVYTDKHTGKELDRQIVLSPNPRVTPTDLEQAEMSGETRARELLATFPAV